MADFSASRTDANLRRAFANETIVGRRCEAATAQAAACGDLHAATLSRDAARRRLLYAVGHMDRLEPGAPGHATVYHLRAAIMHELHESADTYPAMARKAREGGLDDIATWLESLAKSSRVRAARFRREFETSM